MQITTGNVRNVPNNQNRLSAYPVRSRGGTLPIVAINIPLGMLE